MTGDILSVSSLDFGMLFVGNELLYLAPDSGTLVITNLGSGKNILTWSHFITAAENLGLANFTVSWQLEGQFNCNNTAGCGAPAVPVPAAVWLFGSGLLGLTGVSRRRHKM